MCFGSTLSYPLKKILNPCPPRTKFNPHPHAKQCGFPHPPRKCGFPQHARVYPPRAGLYFLQEKKTEGKRHILNA